MFCWTFRKKKFNPRSGVTLGLENDIPCIECIRDAPNASWSTEVDFLKINNCKIINISAK